MAIFLASSKAKSIPASSIKIITENVQELIGTTVTFMKKKVKQIFGEFKEGVANDMSFTEALNFCDALRDPFADMPENSQLEYFKEKGALALIREFTVTNWSCMTSCVKGRLYMGEYACRAYSA